MKRIPPKLFSLSSSVPAAILSALVVVCCVRRALAPGLLLDEGAYTGAAQAVLHGDPFFTRYWFDKLPLGVYLQTFGILAFGSNAFGWRFSGLIFWIVDYFLLLHVLRRISGRSGWSFLPLRLLVTAVFVTPAFLIYGPTALVEAYLLFFLLLFLNEILKGGSEKRIAIYWTLAFFSKLTAVVWLPVLAGHWWKQGIRTPKKIWEAVKGFLRHTWGFWAFAFLLGFLYRMKFSFVSQFSYHGVPAPKSPVGKILTWLPAIREEVWSHWVSLAIFTFLALGLFTLSKKRRRDLLPLFILPFFVHFFVLAALPVQPYNQYLLPFIVQGIILVACLVWDGRRARIISGATVTALSLVIFACDYFRLPPLVLVDSNFGHAAHRVLEEVPSGSLVHTDNLWLVRPYTDFDRVHLNSCVARECLETGTKGIHPEPAQFVLLKKSHGNLIGQTLLQRKGRSWIDRCEVDWSRLHDGAKWRAKLRLGAVSGESELRLEDRQIETREWADGWQEERGIPGVLRFTLDGGKWIERIEMEGWLTVASRYRERGSFDPERDTVGFRVRSLTINGSSDWTNLVPLLWSWRGYFIPLEAIECSNK